MPRVRRAQQHGTGLCIERASRRLGLFRLAVAALRRSTRADATLVACSFDANEVLYTQPSEATPRANIASGGGILAIQSRAHHNGRHRQQQLVWERRARELGCISCSATPGWSRLQLSTMSASMGSNAITVAAAGSSATVRTPPYIIARCKGTSPSTARAVAFSIQLASWRSTALCSTRTRSTALVPSCSCRMPRPLDPMRQIWPFLAWVVGSSTTSETPSATV